MRGTNDYLGAQEARLRTLEARLRAGFEAYGYEGVQTPILEPLELFLRKSGDEILARIYAFVHWNRRLCLRPELTASAMRLYVNELQGRSLPVRLHYAGQTFRYEKPQRGRYRQFTQVGCELIGAAGPAADAEVLHLACEGLDHVGVRSYRLVVGHLGVVLQLLEQMGMSEHAQGLVLDLMEPLTRGRLDLDAAVARVVELIGRPANGQSNGHVDTLPDMLADLPPDEATAVAADILRRARLPIEGGARPTQRIIQRLLAKASRPDPTEQVRAAFEFVLALHHAAGSPEQLQAVRTLIQQRGLSTAPLDEVEAALDMLRLHGDASPAAQWEVDLSLARGLRYYTGFVFEVYVETQDGPLQVAGGGRYDDLIRSLGGRESVPACGFSYGLERIDLVRSPEPDDVAVPTKLLVVPVTEADQAAALSVAREVRGLGGLAVEQDVRLRGPKAALRHADRSGARLVVLIGEQERAEQAVLLRDMRARTERRVQQSELATEVRRLLREQDA